MENRRTYILISALLSMLFGTKLWAELPNLTQEQLADSIQKEEDLIQAFHVKYRLTQGEYSSEDNELIPDVIIDCEYAHDIGKGHRYLHEKWVNHSSEEELERKYAYDGKKGTKLSLKLPGDPGHMYGRIMPKVPDMLDDQVIWKPDFWSGYGFIEGCGKLSYAIRNANIIEVTTEEYDGEELYKVSFQAATGEKIKFVHPTTGKTRWIDKSDSYIAWLSPNKAFRPVKIADLTGQGGVVKYLCIASDFREINQGVWLPFHLERSSIKRRRGRLIEIDTIAINDKVSVVSRLEFSPGTYMKNEKWGIEYRAGRGLITLRLESVTKALVAHLIIGLLLISGVSIFIYYKYSKRKKNEARCDAKAEAD